MITHSRNSIATFSGKFIEPLNPLWDDIEIEDIAHGLSNICRYGGQCSEFYCPTMDQRILTSDLKWVPAGDLKQGSQLVGFDEELETLGSSGVRKRKFKPSIITEYLPVKRKIIRLEMSDGSSVTCSEEHPWLIATKASKNQVWMPSNQIAKDIKNGRRRYAHKFIEPWKEIEGREGGWLAGMYDGEGYVSIKNRQGSQMGIAQNPGEVLNEVRRLLDKYGLPYSQHKTREYKCMSLQTLNGWRGIFKSLGMIRPMRLLKKAQDALESGDFGKEFNSDGNMLEIVKSWDEGEDWVAGIETSSRTYLCEGFGAHNCVAQHSVYVSYNCKPENALNGLLHDGSEAYLGDVPRPLKMQDGYAFYREKEEFLQNMIFQKFGTTFTSGEEYETPDIKNADNQVLLIEQQHLFGKPWVKLQWSGIKYKDELLLDCFKPWSSRVSEQRFMDRYRELTLDVAE